MFTVVADPRIGEWLSARRKELGLSGGALDRLTARYGGRVSQSYLSLLELGHRELRSLSPQKISALRQALKVDPEEWYEHTGLHTTIDALALGPDDEPTISREELQVLLHDVRDLLRETKDRLSGANPVSLAQPNSYFGYAEGEQVPTVIIPVIAQRADEDAGETLNWPIASPRHNAGVLHHVIPTVNLPTGIYVTVNPEPIERVGQIVCFERGGLRVLGYALDLEGLRVRVKARIAEFEEQGVVEPERILGVMRNIYVVDPSVLDAPPWEL